MFPRSTLMRSVAEPAIDHEIEPLTPPFMPTESPVLKRQHTVRGPGDPTPDSNKSFLNFDDYLNAKRIK
jgi:hypothetical protein|uniref:Uncharacterized protein n=1 Tax=viral metagenome TaxID=1070528 RepID=A0A6C0AHH3_9ZZZZ